MDLQLFQIFFDSHNRNEKGMLKDPNILVAEQAGAMSAMGYYEKEFTVYGCCFYKDGKRQYIVSSKEEKIIEFLEDEKNQTFFPTPVEHWTSSVLVPSGTEDSIIRTVKKHFARKLSETYSEAYFAELSNLCNVSENDLAESLLLEWQEDLEGVYDENVLQLFESTLLHARNKRIVTALSYYKMQQWIDVVRKDMLDDVIKKSTYMRAMYGYSYIKPDGKYGYYINACKDSAYNYQQRQIEKGVIVTPLVSKTYHFQNNVTPQQVRDQFSNDLPRIFTEQYWDAWNKIRKIPSPILSEIDCTDMKIHIKKTYGTSAAKAFQKKCFSLDVQI